MSDMAAMLIQQSEAVTNVYKAASREGARSIIEGIRIEIASGRKRGWKAEAILEAIEGDLILFERRIA